MYRTRRKMEQSNVLLSGVKMYKLSQHEEQKNAYVLTSNDYTYVEQLLRRREHCDSIKH